MAGVGALLRDLDARRNDLFPAPQFAHCTKMEELIGPQNNLGHRERVSLVGSGWTRNLERSYRERGRGERPL